MCRGCNWEPSVPAATLQSFAGEFGSESHSFHLLQLCLPNVSDIYAQNQGTWTQIINVQNKKLKRNALKELLNEKWWWNFKTDF